MENMVRIEMENYSGLITEDMSKLLSSINNLTKKVSSASELWKDEKYSELSSSISKFSNEFTEILSNGECLIASIDEFYEISQDEY